MSPCFPSWRSGLGTVTAPLPRLAASPDTSGASFALVRGVVGAAVDGGACAGDVPVGSVAPEPVRVITGCCVADAGMGHADHLAGLQRQEGRAVAGDHPEPDRPLADPLRRLESGDLGLEVLLLDGQVRRLVLQVGHGVRTAL